MKQLLTLFFFISLSVSSSAQSIVLYNVDGSNFPKMKAKFATFDQNGVPVKPQISELKLTENGFERKITGINCPPPKPPNAISSVIVLDVSGSMSWIDRLGNQRIDMAKTAAKSWVRALPSVNTECAIVTFDDRNFLNRDYTSDTVKLMNAIDGVYPQSGTNYMSALLLPVASGLEVTKLAKYQKLIVFITDGQPNFEPDVSAIIAEAKRQNCIIVGVTLNMPAPQCIKDITKATGGDYYENITTLQEAQAVYNTIMQKSLGNDLCDIEWESDYYCSQDIVNGELEWNNQVGKSSYSVPPSSIAELSVSPVYLNFGAVEENIAHDTIITLTAINSDMIVSDISSRYGSSEFTIENVIYPFTILKGQSKIVKVRCLPLDSNLYFNSFEVITDKCNNSFSTSCGEPGRQMPRPTLILTKPDSTDKLINRGDIDIVWKGISPKDTVSIYYSTDKGINWVAITNTASRLKYTWKYIPKINGNSILFKVEQKGALVTKYNYTIVTDTLIYTSIISPKGDLIATGSKDGIIRIWDLKTGMFIKKLVGHKQAVHMVAFSPDGTKLASASFDGTIGIWDIVSGSIEAFTDCNNVPQYGVSYSKDGNTVVACGADSTIRVIDAITKYIINFWAPNNTFYYAVYSPIDGKIALAGLGKHVIIVASYFGDVIYDINLPYDATYVNFNKNGNEVIISTKSNELYIVNLISKTKKTFPLLHNNKVNCFVYSKDFSMVASASDDSTAIVWDLFSMKPVHQVRHKDKVNSVCFSADGKYILSSDYLGDVKLTNIKASILQSDESDIKFEVFNPITTSKNIDMKQCLIGGSSEVMVSDFVKNSGSYKFDVDTIYFTGADASAFELVSNFRPYTLEPTHGQGTEFRFKANRMGKHTANIVVVTQADTLVQSIEGIGVAPQLKVVNDIVNFGVIDLGENKELKEVPTLANIGTAPIIISNIRVQNVNTQEFENLSASGQITINPGDTLKLNLKYNPMQDGRTSGRLIFSHNAAGSQEIVQLFGTANLPVAEKFDVDFGIVDISASRDMNAVVLKNKGKADIIVRGAKIEGANATDFVLVNAQFPITIKPNGEAKFDITYSPKFAGNSNATLVINHNGADGIANIALTGRGTETEQQTYDNPIILIKSIKPNPANEYIEIYYGFNSLEKADIKITSTLGKLVYTGNLEKTDNGYLKIDTRSFGVGQYYITFTSENVVKTEMITIVR